MVGLVFRNQQKLKVLVQLQLESPPGDSAGAKQRLLFVPCTPHVLHDTAHITDRPFLLLQMSKLFGKAKQKVKKKVGQAADLLRPSPREGRAASLAPSLPSGHLTRLASGVEPQSPALTAAVGSAQSPIASKSLAIESSRLADPATASVPSPSPESTPEVPAYAIPPSLPTILATTGSAVKTLLAAARDGSDLFLPLKAALVGVVALWDLFDVSDSILFKSSRLNILQRTVEAKTEFMKLESKLAAFKAIAEAQQVEPRALDESLQARLKSLS